jgi:hypothetical protein
MVRVLGEADELCVPLDVDTMLPKGVPEQALVVILAQDQEVGIGAQTLANVSYWNPCSAPPSRPDVRAHGALPELEGSLRDAEMGVDLEGPSLDTQRSRLQRRTRVAVDDPKPHSAASQLISQHQTGRAGSNDQDISVHEFLSRAAGEEQ